MIFLADKLKSYVLSSLDEDSQQELCPICFTDLVQDLRYFCNENSMIYLPQYQPISAFFDCGHLFCISCANALYDRDQMCPLCRHENIELRQFRDVLRSPSLQANIIRSMDCQLEPFSPTVAKPYELRQWNWYSHDSWTVNFASLWSKNPVSGFFEPYSVELASHIQAAWEMESPVIVSTNVSNKPCYYYIDPQRQFQVSF